MVLKVVKHILPYCIHLSFLFSACIDLDSANNEGKSPTGIFWTDASVREKPSNGVFCEAGESEKTSAASEA